MGRAPWRLGVFGLLPALAGCLGHLPGPDVWLPTCGNGVLGGDETCDDGQPPEDGDGCSARCEAEAGFSCEGEGPGSCLHIPQAPQLQGEPSAGHVQLTWTWPVVEGASVLRARLGDVTRELEGTATAVSMEVAGPGEHTLELVACNAHGRCGPTASFTTTVEFFGTQLTAGWRGVARRQLTTSALGNVAAVSCHNCYNGPGNEVLNAEEMSATIQKALSRGADLIEVDLAELNGVIHATHDDGVSSEGRPTLAEVLAIPALQTSDALLFLEIKEQDGDPSWMARELLSALDANRAFARNGRPVFVRAFEWSTPVLREMQRLAPEFPAVAPYVRYSLLLWSDDAPTSQALADRVMRGVVERGFHAVEFKFDHPALWDGVALARSLGLLVNVYTLPVVEGDILALMLRDQVDMITTDLRVDRVRALVTAADGALGLDVSRGVLSMARSLHGVARRPLELGQAASPQQHGTPVFIPAAWDVGEAGALRFDARAQQALETFKPPMVMAAKRALLAVTASLNRVQLAVGERMVLLAVGDTHGLFLDVVGEEDGTWLRFGSRGREGVRAHRYPLTGLPNGVSASACEDVWYTFVEGISAGQVFQVTGIQEPDGALRLWINMQCAGSPVPRAVAGFQPGGSVMLGAAPTPEPPGAQDHLDGTIVSAGFLLVAPWQPDGALEN
jgi:cysteine-rich repeat protein